MATEGALGRRRAHAIQRIETAAGERLTLPTRSKYDDGMLLILQLEAIADYFESLQPAAVNPPPSDRQIPTLEEARRLMDNSSEQETVEETESTDGDEATGVYQAHTNAELTEMIQERGLDKGKARSKHELIAVLEAADKETENG